jgi:hypothetical protein
MLVFASIGRQIRFVFKQLVNNSKKQKKQTGKAIRESRSTGFQYFGFDICGTHIGHLKCSFCSTTIPKCLEKLGCFIASKFLAFAKKRLFL